MKASQNVISVLLGVGCLLAASIEARADYRPALIGNGPKALVNMIDTQNLAASGQGDGLVMFQCWVKKDGSAYEGAIYRESPNSKRLASAVRKALEHCRFMPALVNGKPYEIQFFGTVTMFMADGKPHLRIYAHQSEDDLKQNKDFVAPQLIAGTEDWRTAKKMVENDRRHIENGYADVAITVDTKGVVGGVKLLKENPPTYGYGAATVKEFTNARFIPGFRDGKPVDCTFTFTRLMRVVPDYIVKPLNASHIPD